MWLGYKELAIMLSTWDQDQNGRSMDIIFSPITQEVFAVHVHDFSSQRAYRMQIEGFNDDKEAWEGVNYTDLESEDDLLDKIIAIFNYEEYDDRIAIPLDLPDEVLLILMKEAHQKDITFNQYLTEIITEKMKQYV
jgi:hypothetical protein